MLKLKLQFFDKLPLHDEALTKQCFRLQNDSLQKVFDYKIFPTTMFLTKKGFPTLYFRPQNVSDYKIFPTTKLFQPLKVAFYNFG